MTSKKQYHIDLHAMLYEVSLTQVTRGQGSVGAELRGPIETNLNFRWILVNLLENMVYKT